jgi:hypothetical protein
MNTDASYVVIHDRVISGYFATSGLSPSAVATGLPSGMAPWCRHVEGQRKWREQIVEQLHRSGYTMVNITGALQVTQMPPEGERITHTYNMIPTLSGVAMNGEAFTLRVAWENAW